MICVYSQDATDFSGNGLCVLTPTACTVTETLNGEWELSMVHPLDDRDKWTYLQTGNIIRAPVPAAMTPRVKMSAISGSSGTLIYKIDTSNGTTPYGTLRLRSKPSSTASVISTYKNGSEVIVLSTSNSSWYEVTAPDGCRGYMMSRYLVYVRTEGKTSGVAAQFVKAKQLRDQPFRIYRVTPTLTEVKVYARHIFYDLLDNMIYSYKPSGSVAGAAAASAVLSQCQSDHKFTMHSDLSAKQKEIAFENTNPIEAILGDEGIISKYKAELARDWYDVYLVQRVGKDTDVEIRQGKNLLGVSYDIDESGVVTRIVPTGEDDDGNILYLPEKYIDSGNAGAYAHMKWGHLPVSDAKESDDMSRNAVYAKLRQAANEEFDNGCDLPTVTLDVDFINVDDTAEYKDFRILHSIYLGDSVRVVVPKLGLTVALRMTQYTYDCLLKKYTKCTLGSATEGVEGSLVSASQLAAGSIGNIKLAFGSVGTGQLQSGSVGSLQVKTAAIGSAHIQQAAISEAHIEDAAITTAKIDDLAVTKAKIAEAAIGSAQIENAAITSAKIDEGAINTAHIGQGQIMEANIMNGAITSAKIQDGAISTAKIGTAQVDTANIHDAAITNAKMAGASIGTANIQDACIVASKIQDASITRAKIADLAVGSAQIDDLAVTTAKIASAAITNAQIANAAVSTAQIALGAITSALIQQGAVGTAQIADASITDAKIVSLNADVITSGTLATERLVIRGENGLIYEINAEASGLTATQLEDTEYESKLNGTVIAARSITAEQIAAATITANEILAGSITGDRIAANTIEGSRIKAGTITTANVSADFGKNLDLSSNTGINLRVNAISQAASAAESNAAEALRLAQQSGSGSGDKIIFSASITAKESISANRLIVGDDSGFFYLASGTPFLIDRPVLVSGSAVAAGASGDDSCLCCPDVDVADAAGLSSWQGTKGNPVYLAGTLENGVFTPSGPFITDTAPEEADGLVYMLLGILSDTETMYFMPEHPMFMFRDDAFQQMNEIASTAGQIASDAAAASVENAAAISALQDRVTMTVSKTTYDGNQEIIEQRLSTIEQTASDFMVEITHDVASRVADVANDVSELVSDVADFRETVTGYMDFDGDSLSIGVNGSSFKTEITNTEMAFTDNGDKVAYISNNDMYITRARVTDTLSVGTVSNGYFDFVTLPGGLALKWRDSSGS
jgi:phage minor structural protein